ncbi:2-dehydro-3-deoxygalactonokinase [Halomonas sp. PAMB 3264]|uniref:2-dehydro-3-deoxygalactonokinase n=1 Tax=Halomonas sp. PAMB 3264 TaxID=3075222 RepID=UPI0028A2CE15|nr:2-dehydro-3-deoxygalactonokinase [Halomonas sp. PAMB 3264]WNL41025.1 2-dehydro-3-deoxygalactonokinase [Halomonas sp. PAMB 3264]
MTSDTVNIRKHLAWIAADWGSSNLRLWAINREGRVIAAVKSDRGMLSLTPSEYEPELIRLIEDWLPERPVDVVVCGMAGARQGWREAAYLSTPTPLDRLSQGAVAPVLATSALRVHLLPGVSQRGADEFDVMRGEETQLAGLIEKTPGFSGLACLPGTHAKWARLENAVLTRFATFMTGEIFELLARHSVLRHSIGDANDADTRDTFQTAVRESAREPERYTQRLFGLRARDLLDTALPQGEARKHRLAARLSGLTIGLELAGARALMEPGETVTLSGGQALCARYALAFEAIDQPVALFDGDTAVQAGLALAHRSLSAG